MAIKGFPFEKSKKDVESKKYGKEGSKKEEAFDRRQMKAKAPAKVPMRRAAGRGC